MSQVTRGEERIFVSLPVSLRTGWGGGLRGYGSTVDFSPRGLRVRANLPLRIGQEVEVVVGQEGTHAKSYCVMWVREPNHAQPIYEAGLELERHWMV